MLSSSSTSHKKNCSTVWLRDFSLILSSTFIHQVFLWRLTSWKYFFHKMTLEVITVQRRAPFYLKIHFFLGFLFCWIYNNTKTLCDCKHYASNLFKKWNMVKGQGRSHKSILAKNLSHSFINRFWVTFLWPTFVHVFRIF